MDIVDDLFALVHVRDYIDFEAAFILVHVGANVFHCELYRVPHLLVKLYLLELILRKYILGRAEYALVSKQFLALLFRDYLLWRLL